MAAASWVAASILANGNTNTFNTYAITPTEIHGSLLAAVLYRNRSGVNKFIAALDRTAPSFSNASFYAYTVGDMNESDLGSVPAGQFGTIESLGFDGNWVIRANGVPVPEPAGAAAVLVTGSVMLRRRRA